MSAPAGDVLLAVQEDDFPPRTETLADFIALCPEETADNARASTLQVGESFVIDEGPLACAPRWTITRTR